MTGNDIVRLEKYFYYILGSIFLFITFSFLAYLYINLNTYVTYTKIVLTSSFNPLLAWTMLHIAWPIEGQAICNN